MALTLVTGPTFEPVTLQEVKDHIRISTTVSATEDTQLLSFIKVARGYCEKYQSRAYCDQTWDLTLETWPDGNIIKIPRPPLQSVTHVKYYSTGNTAATMTAANYFVDTANEPGRVALAYSEVWPGATLRPVNGVVVRYVCGSGSTPSAISTEIKQAIMLIVGDLYEDREDSDIKELLEVPYGVRALLDLERIWPI